MVESGGVRLAVEERGPADGPPVVLLHGLTATRFYVVMGSRALERAGFRVIAYDARGHGASAPAPRSKAYDYAALAGDLAAVLDALGVERAVLAGSSMGAHTLLRFALAHPDRVTGLVAITPAHDPASFRGPERLARWDRLAAGLRSGGVEGFVAAYGDAELPERWREPVKKVLRQRLARHEHPEAVADALETVPRSEPYESLDELGALGGVPVTVVASRDDADPGHPYAVAATHADAIPGAHLVVEEPGRSPLAWQGAQLSRVIADAAEGA